ncbi:hypothetical protein SAMN05444166_0414 [Singulisphaera sp. GP187]|nr:hypothetical protein SAMN05444166_0414 [Singulisphaera sp. GP187]
MGRKKSQVWLRVFFGPSTSFTTLSPWDRGSLEAHWMHTVRSQRLRELQAKAMRQRRGIYAKIWPPRRKYLDGLLHGLAGELHRRDKGD